MHFTYALRISCMAFATASLLLLGACGQEKPGSDQSNPMNTSDSVAVDVHTHARPQEAQVTHLDLDIRVDFEQQVLRGSASFDFENKTGTDKLVLDARGLDIQAVMAGEDSLTFELGPEDPVLGSALEIGIREGDERVTVHYATGPGAAALQWLAPVQTAGKESPFLFTQGQAILSRTWIPCQDSPGIRFSYTARVEVPAGLMAVMSATNPQELDPDGVYEFEMAQPIPAYLIALAVGDLRFEEIGPRTGVYAEPSVLEGAAYEFGEMEDMLVAAEGLYGKYRWERYDVIVLPPSFPFGGMENPRLTFATPTILAGDRSLTSLIAHELAHSWSGNLVTNATWDDFWLNEGFTVYFEQRIMEALYGKSYVQMLSVLGYQDLKGSLGSLEQRDTHLKLDLKGRDPDDGMTDIAYEKGNFFLRHIEQIVGRDTMDAFLKEYFDSHAFQTMTTEAFVAYLDKELVKGDADLRERINVEGWIYGPGLPKGAEVPFSDRFERVDAQIAAWRGGLPLDKLDSTENWTTHEWLHFIRALPGDLDERRMAELDGAFGFTQSGNSEILAAWFDHVIRHNYQPAYPAMEAFLLRVGRRKFLKPIYKALAATPEGLAWARKVYAQARPNYHSVSVGTIDGLLSWEG